MKAARVTEPDGGIRAPEKQAAIGGDVEFHAGQRPADVGGRIAVGCPAHREAGHRFDASVVVEDLRVREQAPDGPELFLRKTASGEMDPDHGRKGAVAEVLFEERDVSRYEADH